MHDLIEIDKAKYAAFCAQHQDVPIFIQPWWMDAVASGHQWLALCINGAHLHPQGIWPLYMKQKWGIHYSTLPRYTPYSGPWYANGKSTPPQLSELMKHLPKAISYLMHPYYDPSAAQLHSAKPKYTYVLHGNQSPEDVWQNMAPMTRNLIERAHKKITITKKADLGAELGDLEVFLRSKRLLEVQTIPLLLRIWQETTSRNCGQWASARDAAGNWLAGLLTVSDAHTTYALVIASHPERKRMNAIKVLLWQAIAESLSSGKHFDFEGGNVDGIGAFFASFGAQQVTYPCIRYSPFPVMRPLLNRLFS